MSAEIDAQQILDVPMQANDAGATTIEDYLVTLLLTLWREGEGFSGKRPFGNSSWQYDLYAALVKDALVRGSLDADGYLEDFDERAADALIERAISALSRRTQVEAEAE